MRGLLFFWILFCFGLCCGLTILDSKTQPQNTSKQAVPSATTMVCAPVLHIKREKEVESVKSSHKK